MAIWNARAYSSRLYVYVTISYAYDHEHTCINYTYALDINDVKSTLNHCRVNINE